MALETSDLSTRGRYPSAGASSVAFLRHRAISHGPSSTMGFPVQVAALHPLAHAGGLPGLVVHELVVLVAEGQEPRYPSSTLLRSCGVSDSTTLVGSGGR